MMIDDDEDELEEKMMVRGSHQKLDSVPNTAVVIASSGMKRSF